MAMASFTPAELLKRFPEDLSELHLTFLTPDGVATFASDNAKHLKAWWLMQMAKLRNPDRDHWCVLNKREFTSAPRMSPQDCRLSGYLPVSSRIIRRCHSRPMTRDALSARMRKPASRCPPCKRFCSWISHEVWTRSADAFGIAKKVFRPGNMSGLSGKGPLA